ncbi:MAG: ABC transporter substrate-binding protein, partial [Bacillota bacterium]
MKKKLSLGLALVLVMALVLSACGKAGTPAPSTDPSAPGSEAPASEAPALEGEVVIGSILDTSGGMAAAGLATVWGADYAVKEINDNGGINGKKLKIVH